MANAVSDIIINITAQAGQAVQELNNVKATVQNTVNTTRSSMGNFNKSIGDTAASTQSSMANANMALTTFERQAGLGFNGARQRMGNFGDRMMKFGNTVQTSMTNAGNRITGFGKSVQDKIGGQSAMAFAAAGAAALSFSKQCISAAMNAESSWARYGALVNSSGGNWQQQSTQVKQWAKNVSNSYGYAVSDTREASATLMQAGNSFSFVQNNMQSVAALAARTGTTQAEASQMIVSALNGRAQALKKATGLEIENYKAADGTIDKQRLMTDILNQNKGALESHSNTTEAAVARMENAWGSFKTSIGTAMLPVVQTLVPIIQGIADAFNKLPGPVKTAIAGLLLVGGAIGVALGFLGLIAPAIVTIGGFISSAAAAGGVIAYLGSQVALVGGAFPFLAGGVGAVAGALLPIIAIVAGVVAGLYLLYEAGKRLGWWNDLGGMFAKFGETLSWVGGQIMGFVQWLGLLVTDFPAAMDKLGNFVNNIGPAISSFLSQLGPLLGEMGNIIGEALGNLGSMIADKIGSGDLTTGVLRLVAPIPMIIYNALAYIAPMVMPALQNLGNAILTGLGNALSGLGGAIAGALSNLGNSVDGGGLMSGIRAMLTPVPTLVGQLLSRIGPIVRPILANAWNGIVATFRQLATRILTTITSIPTRVGMAFMRLVTIIRLRINQARAIAGVLMTNLRNMLIQRITSIPQRVGMIFQLLVQIVRTRLTRAWAAAQQLAGQIRQAIVDKIMEMYHGVQSWFGNLASNIGSWLSTAASNTLSGAKQIYDNIVNKVKEIPQKVADEFGKIPGKISSALASAASAAASGAAAIISSFKSALGIASPGYAQRMTEAEFNTIPGHIETSGIAASATAYRQAGNIVSSWSRGMPGVLRPAVEFDTTAALSDMKRNLNIELLGSNFQNLQRVPTSSTASLAAPRTVNHEDNTRNITIENVTLDCSNLTQAQSRRILYNALQGL